MTIKTLFDPAKNIYRKIEKVITYSAAQEARSKAEITEYIATDSIEEHFEELLTKLQIALESGGENDIGVWVSGFYGCGKSSFTKYLGLALDETVKIEGVPFVKYLQDRLKKPQTKALLATVASKFPAAVVLLDLASEMLAGATMEDVFDGPLLQSAPVGRLLTELEGRCLGTPAPKGRTLPGIYRPYPGRP